MMSISAKMAHFHLPGMFEFYELYRKFIPLFFEHREFFYDWCDIGSVYGAPADCIWSGGRIELSDYNVKEVLNFYNSYNISGRLTFSNSLVSKEHLSDNRCNSLCELFSNSDVNNGVIVHSDLLMEHIKNNYPNLYFVSSTTKVLTDFEDFLIEINRSDFKYVVPDFRLNKSLDLLSSMDDNSKDKVEFLINECCYVGCKDRHKCYEDVSHKALGDVLPDHICTAPGGNDGYKFSKAMLNPSFISIGDITNTYLPMGFTNFKMEGRSLGSALILEFLLYYMTKPEYQINVREAMYLDNMLDLF